MFIMILTTRRSMLSMRWMRIIATCLRKLRLRLRICIFFIRMSLMASIAFVIFVLIILLNIPITFKGLRHTLAMMILSFCNNLSKLKYHGPSNINTLSMLGPPLPRKLWLNYFAVTPSITIVGLNSANALMLLLMIQCTFPPSKQLLIWSPPSIMRILYLGLAANLH